MSFLNPALSRLPRLNACLRPALFRPVLFSTSSFRSSEGPNVPSPSPLPADIDPSVVNKVVLIGRICGEVYHRELPNNLTVVNLQVVTDEKETDDNGSFADAASTYSYGYTPSLYDIVLTSPKGKTADRQIQHRVVSWDQGANTWVSKLEQGTLVFVEGPLRYRIRNNSTIKQWTSQIKADRIVIIESPPINTAQNIENPQIGERQKHKIAVDSSVVAEDSV